MAKKAVKKSRVKFSAFDAADYLDNEAVIAEYLSLAASDENADVLLKALSDVAKARGMSQVAKDTGLGRKALAPGAKPRFETISAVMKALKVRIEIVAR